MVFALTHPRKPADGETKPKLPPLDSATYARLSALQKACADPEKLVLALAQGMDPNQRFDFNAHSRPLFRALSTQPWNSALARILLDAGADPNLADDRGHAPIRAALCYAHNGPEAYATALAIASHPDLRAPDGDDLLSLAFYAPGLVPILASKGYDPNILCEEASFLLLEGKDLAFKARPSALGRCISFGTIGAGLAAKELIAAGADVNLDSGGISPLACALCSDCSGDVIEILLNAGANPLWSRPDGLDCLAMANIMDERKPRAYRSEALAIFRQARLARVEAMGLEALLDATAKPADRPSSI